MMALSQLLFYYSSSCWRFSWKIALLVVVAALLLLLGSSEASEASEASVAADEDEDININIICRICGTTSSSSSTTSLMTLPDKEVIYVEGDPSCAEIDEYIGIYYQVDSQDCYDAQQLLYEYCGCQEEQMIVTTSSPSNTTTTDEEEQEEEQGIDDTTNTLVEDSTDDDNNNNNKNNNANAKLLYCRLCPYESFTYNLNAVVTYFSTNPTCLDIDWYISHYYEYGSEICNEAQNGLNEFCGCRVQQQQQQQDYYYYEEEEENSQQEEEEEEEEESNINNNYNSFYSPVVALPSDYNNDDHNDDSPSDSSSMITTIRDGCILCPNKEPVQYPDAIIHNTTCIELAAIMWIEELDGSSLCNHFQELYTEYCGCSEMMVVPNNNNPTHTNEKDHDHQKQKKCNWCKRGITKPDAYMIKNYDNIGSGATCSDGALIWDDLDSNSEICHKVTQANFRCGCSEGMGFDHPYTEMKTMRHYKVYVWLPRIVGLLSMAGSMYILYDCFKDKNKRCGSTQPQILIGMSFIDFLSSFMYVLGPIPAQEYDHEGLWLGNIGSYGTETTCKVQGFFIQLGLSATFYNISLSAYYYLVVVRNWREIKFQQTKAKYVMLILPIVIGLALAWGAIPYYQGFQGFCDLPVSDLVYYSLLALEEQGGGDNDGQEVQSSWRNIVVFLIVPLSISIISVTILTIATYCHVRKLHVRSSKWRFGHNDDDDDDKRRTFSATSTTSQWNNKNNNNGSEVITPTRRSSSRSSSTRRPQSVKDLVFGQAIFYLLGFYLTWPLLLVILCLPLEKVSYAMRLTVVSLLPYQGFHNFLVYVRPRYVKYKLEKTRRLMQEESLANFVVVPPLDNVEEGEEEEEDKNSPEEGGGDLYQVGCETGKTSSPKRVPGEPEENKSSEEVLEFSDRSEDDRLKTVAKNNAIISGGCFDKEAKNNIIPLWSTCASNEVIDA